MGRPKACADCAGKIPPMHDTLVILIPALAMGLGWGIRGQFGHETGAMVPGALVGLALAAVAFREIGPAEALRLGAVGALACSLGGLMTYGHTIGLVQGRTRRRTRGWGLLGLGIKGAVWIGLTGAFVGMAAGRCAHGPWEVAALCVALAGIAWAGVRLLNRPHDPPNGQPAIYFSQRLAERTRPEFWGGLWLALAALLVYLIVRGDRLAVGLALFGLVGGGLGFPLGECLQSWGMHHAPFGPRVQRWMDWWKVMEVSFGLLAGAALGLGWLLLGASGDAPQLARQMGDMTQFAPYRVGIVSPISPPALLEALLLALWLAWLLMAERGPGRANAVWEASFVAIALPMALAFGGGLTPAFVVAPLLLLVSGDNVVRQWSVREKLIQPAVAWIALALAVVTACNLARHWVEGRVDAPAWLLLTAWVQTGLTVLWALGSREVFARGWLWPRVAAARGQVTVQAVFVALALLLSLLVAWSRA